MKQLGEIIRDWIVLIGWAEGIKYHLCIRSGVVAHTCHPGLERWRQTDQELKVFLKTHTTHPYPYPHTTHTQYIHNTHSHAQIHTTHTTYTHMWGGGPRQETR